MVIKQNDDGKNGVFYIGEYADRLGEIIYSWKADNLIVIEHTEVDDTLEGKGIGKQLVESVVELARAKKSKILPLCSFAKHLFDKTPEFSDVLLD